MVFLLIMKHVKQLVQEKEDFREDIHLLNRINLHEHLQIMKRDFLVKKILQMLLHLVLMINHLHGKLLEYLKLKNIQQKVYHVKKFEILVQEIIILQQIYYIKEKQILILLWVVQMKDFIIFLQNLLLQVQVNMIQLHFLELLIDQHIIQ